MSASSSTGEREGFSDGSNVLVDALDLEVVGGLLAAGDGGEPVVLQGVGEVVAGVRDRELVEQCGGLGGGWRPCGRGRR